MKNLAQLCDIVKSRLIAVVPERHDGLPNRPCRVDPQSARADWCRADLGLRTVSEADSIEVGSVELPLNWKPADELPVAYANAFLVQYDTDHHMLFLTLAAVPPPTLLEAAKQDKTKMEELITAGADIQPIARIAIGPADALHLSRQLESTYESYLNVAKHVLAERRAELDQVSDGD